MENKDSIIRMFNVSKRYGKKHAVKDISLDIAAGEFIFVTGPSGAGKSTLMKLIYLAERATQGQILIDGMNIDRISYDRVPFLRRRIGVIFQDFKLIPNRSVFANVALVLEAAGVKQLTIKNRVMTVLKTMGIADKANAFPPSLSGGEQQRVAIARAVVGNPRIILADEPTGSLDNRSAQMVLDYLMQYNDRGATILIASHNIQLISSTVRARSISLVDGVLAGTARML
ncbi:FtsE [Desulforapulum autotrophicum HRM2]|uniref:Cell division ATP-binding protein FtsE n=1 Tax=Desulforapulum autotrophicum (strain ATCC 43914 / DSM 3382 / VKM B-1955 / HRM2) TaxID=177437 RepID=C0QLV2_DESAH|nr:cell division ATP-binding protein FtsE [Desulforapulum autotrophicum]ACN14258.1 FtsE [Desulforapulum autotrophicum HRM2]